jgi:hypothetical protein
LHAHCYARNSAYTSACACACASAFALAFYDISEHVDDVIVDVFFCSFCDYAAPSSECFVSCLFTLMMWSIGLVKIDVDDGLERMMSLEKKIHVIVVLIDTS